MGQQNLTWTISIFGTIIGATGFCDLDQKYKRMR